MCQADILASIQTYGADMQGYLHESNSANGHIIPMIRLVDYDLLQSIAVLIIGFPLSVV